MKAANTSLSMFLSAPLPTSPPRTVGTGSVDGGGSDGQGHGNLDNFGTCKIFVRVLPSGSGLAQDTAQSPRCEASRGSKSSPEASGLIYLPQGPWATAVEEGAAPQTPPRPMILKLLLELHFVRPRTHVSGCPLSPHWTTESSADPAWAC